MSETYTVSGGLQVAGKMPGETITRKDLEEARCSDENIAALISSGVITLDEKPAKPTTSSTTKTKTGE